MAQIASLMTMTVASVPTMRKSCAWNVLLDNQQVQALRSTSVKYQF